MEELLNRGREFSSIMIAFGLGKANCQLVVHVVVVTVTVVSRSTMTCASEENEQRDPSSLERWWLVIKTTCASYAHAPF